jgi:hypothetical protein
MWPLLQAPGKSLIRFYYKFYLITASQTHCSFSLIIGAMKSIRFTARSIAPACALTVVLAYGLLLPLTGFYWDDWPFAWIAKFLGPKEFIPAFSGFRPFLGPIFFVTTSLIPTNPILWQIFALVIRFLAGLSVFFALNQIWPTRQRQNLMVVFLFLVFPGYSQQWVALTHINQEWIPFIFYLLSFGLTAFALRSRPKFWTSSIIAFLLLILGLFPTEYFIGLEPLRFLFIWVILSEEIKSIPQLFLQTIKRWRPYFLVWLLDAGWLAYYYKSGAYISYGVTTARKTPGIIEIISAFGDALWKAGLYIWIQILVLAAKSISAPTTLLTLVLILVSFILAAFYLLKLNIAQENSRTIAFQFIIIGLIGILLGRVPSFAAGLPLTLQSSFDRFMISMMLGGSIFMAGLVELLIKNPRAKNYTFAFLIALGIGQQFFNANLFRRDWSRQQEIYWQLAWRIPALKPNTILLADYVPIDDETDLSFTAPINWMYAPDFKRSDLPYAMLYMSERLGGAALPDIKPGTAIQLPYRTVTFYGNTLQAIVIHAPANACLQVFDRNFDSANSYGNLPSDIQQTITLSDTSNILADGSARPPFGTEPNHDWCYYYEKAGLARQSNDWQKIIELGKQANQQNLKANNAFEQLPFIEAYAMTAEFKSAGEITRQAWTDEPKSHKALCALWKRLQANGPDETRRFASSFLVELGCGQ